MANTSVLFVVCCFVLGKAAELTAPDVTIIIPKECEGNSFCDVEPADYPHVYFEKYISGMQTEVQTRFKPRDDDITTPDTRIDEENCSTETRILHPFVVKSNTTTKLVLQTKYFKQRVYQTRCLNHRASCFKSIRGLGYTSTCEEHYGDIQLYLYDPIEKRVKHETVNVPMCCRCVTQRSRK